MPQRKHCLGYVKKSRGGTGERKVRKKNRGRDGVEGEGEGRKKKDTEQAYEW